MAEILQFSRIPKRWIEDMKQAHKMLDERVSDEQLYREYLQAIEAQRMHDMS